LVEAAVKYRLSRVDRDPDRIDAVGVGGADGAADRVGAAGDDRGVIDGKRQLRRAGAVARAEARRGEQ